jgi:hypothetical protein
MRVAAKWSVCVLLVFLVLLVALWVGAIAQQWWARRDGQKLLGTIRTIAVGRTTEAEIKPLLDKWRASDGSEPYCDEQGCQYRLDHISHLPGFLIGNEDESARNWLPRLADHLGIRRSRVLVEVTVRNGVVTGKSFAMEVGLPVRVWFDREGACVPELTVSSEETVRLPDYDERFRAFHQVVRSLKGELGIVITFDNDVPAERDLLNFHFQCMTQFSPCLSENELLPGSVQLLQKSRGCPR